MAATYFHRNGAGHSLRGQIARDNGAMSWSKLPKELRHGFTSKQAELLSISDEWHHAGKYANEVHVYYTPQVEAFWAAIEAEGFTVADMKEWVRFRVAPTTMTRPERFAEMSRAVNIASDAAETVREEL